MNIKIFKPIGSPEIIAELITESDTHYVVDRPLTIHIMRGADGNPSLGFSEFSMVTSEKHQRVRLNRNALICDALEPIPEIAQNYQQNVTGLILPTTGGQILTG